MAEIRRSLGVAGWDADAEVPLGVVSPGDHRRSVQMLAAAEGVFATSEGTAALGRLSGTQVSLGSGVAAIEAPDGDGWFFPSWDSTTLDLGVGAAQERIVSVVVEQKNYTDDSNAKTSPALISILTGAASATPVAPIIASGQLELWRVRIPAGATVGTQFIFIRKHSWTAPVGGRVPVPTDPDLVAWDAPMDTEARVVATGELWRKVAGGWEFTPAASQQFHLDGYGGDAKPPSGAAPMLKMGSFAGPTPGNGHIVITFDTPFPSQCSGAITVTGDGPAYPGRATVEKYDAQTLETATDNAGNLTRINWLAWGF